MTHSCVSCKTLYESEEPDAYFCPPCLEIHKQLIAKLDAKPRKKLIVYNQPLPYYESISKGIKIRTYTDSRTASILRKQL